jgi:hypothetical protein
MLCCVTLFRLPVEDTDIRYCFFCRSWHGCHQPRCPKSIAYAACDLINTLIAASIRLALIVYGVYIYIALAGLVTAVLYLALFGKSPF